MERTIKAIAHIKSDYPEKFGIPRQSGIVNSNALIIFEPEYRQPNALRGIEGYSHLWLIWEFSESIRNKWTPMVHPPRLGGNTLMGVFATRSPFRPNPIGLSSVRLIKTELTKEFGTVLHISGADLMDGTPIYDIKPYLPYTDSHPEAVGGFSDRFTDYRLEVIFPEKYLCQLAPDKRAAAAELLAQDPRPSYQDDPNRVYGTAFADKNILFKVNSGVLTVCAIEDYSDFLDRKNDCK